MKLLKKAWIWFLLFIFTIFSVNALVLEWDIKLDEATTDSLKISWNEVDWAIGYFVYYDTQSHFEDKNYANTTDDMVESTGTTLENLDSNTTYYIALKVVDWEWNEWDFSKEYSFSTLKWEEKNLSIENIKVIDSKNLEVTFNSEIDSSKDIEFKIEEKNNNLNEVNIANTLAEGNIVKISLNNELESNKDYTLTVISLTWVNWETIEEGVNGVIDFNSGELIDLNSAEEENPQNTSAWTSDDNITENPEDTTNNITENPEDTANNASVEEVENTTQNSTEELNSAGPSVEPKSTALSWANLTNEQIKKTSELAAKKIKKLPQTGPAEWLLIIAALILAFWIIKYRKQA